MDHKKQKNREYSRKYRLKQLERNAEKFKRQRAIDVDNYRERIKSRNAELSKMKPRKSFIGTEDCVKKFYALEMISRYLPGKKDFVTVKEKGMSQQLQKQVMLMTLLEAHGEFEKMFPDRKISLSKFSKLRPKNIVLMCDAPLNSCCCIYCENMKLLFDSLKPYLQETYRSVSDFLSGLVCDSDNFSCMRNRCSSCSSPTLVLQEIIGSEKDSSPVKLFHWEKVEGFMQKTQLGGKFDKF